MQTYSAYFKTLHNETNSTGYLGQGTHYSALRALVFHDPSGEPLAEGKFANFAVIWDEDHDTRVMEPIEEIYRLGLLPSFIVFGERKGCFTAIVSPAINKIPFDQIFLRRVEEFELSIRAAACLKNGRITYIGELVRMTEAEMLRTPNFGRKPLNEIKEALAKMGLHLGMDVRGWAPDITNALVKDQSRVGFLKVKINEICESLKDPWTVEVAALESLNHRIIDDESKKVDIYLRNLEMLWQLGTNESRASRDAIRASSAEA
jgi:hypothetical protein